MRLLLVRHGETEDGENNLLLGLLDPPLNQKGISQAERLALKLKNEKINIIFSSDLKRAEETARIINKYHNLCIEFSKELRERNFGIFEGQLKQKLIDSVNKSGEDFYLYKPKKGESCLEVQERAVTFFKRLIKEQINKTVLLVSHGAVLTELLFYLTKLPRKDYGRLHQEKTALGIVEFKSPEEYKVKVINSTDHLK